MLVPAPRALTTSLIRARLAARKLLSHYPGPVFLAMEQDVAYADSDDMVWRITSTDAILSLSEVLSRIRSGGRLPAEPPLTRKTPPTDLTVAEEPESVPDLLLSAVLKPAEKRILDHLADWPWIAPSDLGGLTGLSRSGVSRLTSRLGGLGLVCAVSLSGRRRLALSRRGLALLARRDRASVSVTIKRWGVETDTGEMASSWRRVLGVRSRPLARTIVHTEAVHRFMATLVTLPRSPPPWGRSGSGRCTSPRLPGTGCRRCSRRTGRSWLPGRSRACRTRRT